MKQIKPEFLRYIKAGYGIGGGITPPANPPRLANKQVLDVSSNPEPAKKEES